MTAAGPVREIQVTFDCADPGALARFWCEVLGYRLQPPPDGFASWDDALESWGVPTDQRNARASAVPPEGSAGPRLYFQQVPEGKAAKNRVHLDIRAAPGLTGAERAAALERECDRLLALGATLAWRLEPDGVDELCLVLRDPEGNEFCLD